MAARAPRLTIGTLARRCGVGVETIRFYEREKLIDQPARPARGYRSYAPDTIERIRFIRRAKSLGFSLNEIRELLSLRMARGRSCNVIRQTAVGKISSVEEKVNDLLRLRAALEELVRACDGTGTVEACRILQALSTEEENNTRTIEEDQSWQRPLLPRAAKRTARAASKPANGASRSA